MVFDTIKAEAESLALHVELCAQRHKHVADMLDEINAKVDKGIDERSQILVTLSEIKQDLSQQKRMALAAVSLLLSLCGTIFAVYGDDIARALLRAFAG